MNVMAKGKSGGKRANGRSAANGGSGVTQNEFKLLGGLPDNERKDFYYHVGMAEPTLEKVKNDGNYTKYAKDYSKYEAILVNEDMPTLTGSDKQISWAENLRTKAITNQITMVSKQFTTNDIKDAFMNRISSTFNVTIDTFSDAVNKFISEDPNGAFKYFKNTTSAGDIINKYR